MLKTAVLNMSCNCQERCVMEFFIEVSDNIKIKVENFAKSRLRDKCFLYRSSPPEVFCEKRCSKRFRKIHRKTPMSGSLF